MNKLATWVCERAHRTCTELIAAQHDAVVAGAEAHHATRKELADVRAENARLVAQVNTLAAAGYRLDEELSAAGERIQTLEEALNAASRRQEVGA